LSVFIPRVHCVLTFFSHMQPKHVLKGKYELLNMIKQKEYADGLDVGEVIDAYPSVLDDLQVIASCLIFEKPCL
jgi:hypothetical protein